MADGSLSIFSSSRKQGWKQESKEVVGDGIKLTVFGTTKNLSKIQQLYSVARHYSCQQSQDFTNLRARNSEHSTYFGKILDNLDAAIEEKMPNPTSPDYNRYIAMKATSYSMQRFVNFKMNRQFAEKVLALVDPIKSTPEGLVPFLRAVRDIAAISEQDSDVQSAIMLLNDGMKLIDEFQKAGKEFLSEEETFGGKSVMSNSKWLDDQRYVNSFRLFHKYWTLKDEIMLEKFIFPALQALESVELRALSVVEHQEINAVFTVRLIVILMEYLLKNRYFAQVNHIVAVLMFHLVKNGRTAGSTEKLSEIDSAKSMVCYWYARWAYEILCYTHFMANYFTYDKLANLDSKPIRTEMIRFDAVVEPGVEIYENQFPLDVIESAKEWEKVVKNGKAWCQRAIDNSKKYKQTEVEVTYEEEQATKLMKGLFHIDKDQNIF